MQQGITTHQPYLYKIHKWVTLTCNTNKTTTTLFTPDPAECGTT